MCICVSISSVFYCFAMLLGLPLTQDTLKWVKLLLNKCTVVLTSKTTSPPSTFSLSFFPLLFFFIPLLPFLFFPPSLPPSRAQLYLHLPHAHCGGLHDGILCVALSYHFSTGCTWTDSHHIQEGKGGTGQVSTTFQGLCYCSRDPFWVPIILEVSEHGVITVSVSKWEIL